MCFLIFEGFITFFLFLVIIIEIFIYNFYAHGNYVREVQNSLEEFEADGSGINEDVESKHRTARNVDILVCFKSIKVIVIVL